MQTEADKARTESTQEPNSLLVVLVVVHVAT